MSKVQIRSARLLAKRPSKCVLARIPFFDHHSRTAGFCVATSRGTDDVEGLGSLFQSNDLRTGWPIGGGALTIQARLAMEFYFSVKNDPANAGKEIILTGHALGERRAA